MATLTKYVFNFRCHVVIQILFWSSKNSKNINIGLKIVVDLTAYYLKPIFRVILTKTGCKTCSLQTRCCNSGDYWRGLWQLFKIKIKMVLSFALFKKRFLLPKFKKREEEKDTKQLIVDEVVSLECKFLCALLNI